MTRRTRLARFFTVGAAGALVQLLSLAAINRACPGHYLLATTAALELTLLHNFFWHLRYTWPDRTSNLRTQLLRFHLANGAVSLLGNLVLMRILVHTFGLPVVAANALAIAGCSLLNFTLGDLWAFRTGPPPRLSGGSVGLQPHEPCLPPRGASAPGPLQAAEPP